MKWGTRVEKRSSKWQRAFAWIPTLVDHGVYRGQFIWLRHYWWRWESPKSLFSDKQVNADLNKPHDRTGLEKGNSNGIDE